VYAYVKNADTRAVAGKQPIDVLIASKRVPAGTAAQDVRTGNYLRVDHLPADATPQGAIKAVGTDWESEPTNSSQDDAFRTRTGFAREQACALAQPLTATVELDGLVWHLLWHNYAGLVGNIIWAVLRGEDHFYSRAEGRRKLLWPRLLLSRVRGRKPALRKDDLRASIQRLTDRGEVAQTGAYRYRLTRYIARDQARKVPEAARAVEYVRHPTSP